MFDKTKIYRSKSGISYQYHGKIETDKGPMHRFKSNKNVYPIDVSHKNVEADFKRHFGSAIADNEKKSGGAKKLQSRLAARLLRNKNRESSQMKTEDLEAATNFLIAEGYEVNEENLLIVLESDSFKRDDGVETIQESTADRYAAWISQKSAAHRNSALVGSNELNESHNDKDQQTFVPK